MCNVHLIYHILFKITLTNISKSGFPKILAVADGLPFKIANKTNLFRNLMIYIILSYTFILLKVMTLELTRGWNSRLGFSLQNNNKETTIMAIYEDSVAAKDGRLKVGDVILEVKKN